MLTASGGPFRGRTARPLADVTLAQALAHPTWAMGPVVTINSATLMNKGLEVIEAHLLFGVPFDGIDVVVHPQSVVHSMVEFIDGSTIAQASPPDMRCRSRWAWAGPTGCPTPRPRCDWTTAATWTSSRWTRRPSRPSAWRARAGAAGGTAPAVFNARERGLRGRLPRRAAAVHRDRRHGRPRVVDEHLGGAARWSPDPRGSTGTIGPRTSLAADAWARARARELVGGWSGTASMLELLGIADLRVA